MSPSDKNTKEIILDTALDLFQTNGYSTVSIRDICKIVGIKESSVYYHFKNKEDILNTILLRTGAWVTEKKSRFRETLEASVRVPREAFIAVGVSYIEKCLLEEKIFKVIRMLTIEKQRNEAAADLYHELLFTLPTEHQTQVFSIMMKKGFFREDSPEVLASEYQALIIFVFQKYFSGSKPISSDARSSAAQELSLLLKRFYDRYFQ